MGKLLFLIIAVVFVIGIFSSRGTNKLIWFFTGIFFFQERILLLESPTVVSFHRLLIYSLVISEICFSKNLLVRIKYFPIARTLFLLLIGVLLIGIFDTRHNIFLNLYRVLDDYLQSFFIIFLCYSAFKKKETWESVVKCILYSSLLLSFYGLYNFFTKSNPYDDFLTKTYNTWSASDLYGQIFSERFRVNSFASTPIYYGYLCGIFLIVAVYSFYNLKRLRYLSLMTMPFSLINLILSNSRTPFIAFLIGMATFVLAGLDLKKKAFLFVSIIILAIGMYNVPAVQDKINSTLEIFSSAESKTTGSSLEMRTNQLRASYHEFLKAPIFGNGFFYINENLGWAKKAEDRIRDDDFEGFESYVYHLLIEQGLVGIIVNILFFVSIWIYFVKKRRLNKQLSALGLAVLITFMVFITGTGTVNSWFISMGLMGIIIKYIEQASIPDIRIQQNAIRAKEPEY